MNLSFLLFVNLRVFYSFFQEAHEVVPRYLRTISRCHSQVTNCSMNKEVDFFVLPMPINVPIQCYLCVPNGSWNYDKTFFSGGGGEKGVNRLT